MGECFLMRMGWFQTPDVNPDSPSNPDTPETPTLVYSYTGEHTEEDAIFGGVEYRLLTLISSGTLTVSREIEADVWLCGGGGNGNVGDDGGTNTNQESGGGGGSGYAVQQSIVLSDTSVATIGAASGITTFGSISANGAATPQNANSSFLYNGNKGGAGGGAGARLYMTDEMGDDGYYVSYTTSGGVGIGSGESQSLGTPFNASADDYNFGSSLGAGGGGAQYFDEEAWSGGDGGNYGENGKFATLYQSSFSAYAYGGKGAGGGGNGGDSSNTYTGDPIRNVNGRDATWYGCGGGGGGFWGQSSTYGGTAGSGYQGVIYIRIKKEDVA